MALSKEVQDILTTALKKKSSAYFSADSVNIAFQTKLLSLSKDKLIIENTVIPKYISPVSHAEAYFFQVDMVRLRADKIDSDGQNIIFPISENSLIEEGRRAERSAFTVEDKAVCDILNPFDEETWITRSLLDLSSTGMSLRTTFASKLFESGNYLPQITIRLNNEVFKKAAGTVIYHRKLMNFKGHIDIQVGIKFES